MITKYNLFESVRDQMTPKSEEEIFNAFRDFIMSYENPLSKYPINAYTDFGKISRILKEPKSNLHYINAHMNNFQKLNTFFKTLVTNEKNYKNVNLKDSSKRWGGSWICYPNKKLANFGSFNDAAGWVFCKDYFKEKINESVRDKMTPKSEEDIRYSMGEKKYHIYKSLRDAKDSIKPPYETTDIVFGEGSKKGSNFFDIKIRFLSLTVWYNGDLWSVSYAYNSDEHINRYNTWTEAWNGILEFTNQSLSKEISTVDKVINIHQKNINELRDLLNKIE